MPVEDRLSDALAGLSSLTSSEDAYPSEPVSHEIAPLIPDDLAMTEFPDNGFTETRRGGPLVALGAGALVLAVAAGIWFTTRAPAAQASSGAARPVEGAQTGGRKPGMPDLALTPGDRGPAPRAEADIPPAAASSVLAGYGMDPQRHVVVRLIPASLGGTDDPKNLFPVTPWFADLKSRLDRKLTGLVESKTLTVEEADEQLRTNWVAAVHKNYVRNYGHKDENAAKQKEDQLVW